MHGDVDDAALIGPAEHMGNEDQMARRGHGQGFGQPLDGGEDEYVNERHGESCPHSDKAGAAIDRFARAGKMG